MMTPKTGKALALRLKDAGYNAVYNPHRKIILLPSNYSSPLRITHVYQGLAILDDKNDHRMPSLPANTVPDLLAQKNQSPLIRDLVQQTHNEQNPQPLCILADVLEEAGYQDEIVLKHLRLAGMDSWVLDILTDPVIQGTHLYSSTKEQLADLVRDYILRPVEAAKVFQCLRRVFNMTTREAQDFVGDAFYLPEYQDARHALQCLSLPASLWLRNMSWPTAHEALRLIHHAKSERAERIAREKAGIPLDALPHCP